MASSRYARLMFPCDCISATPRCQEPWARVAKAGMFKDGTKEVLLNLLSRRPKTIAQLARQTRLAQPTVFRHIRDLTTHHLVREVQPKSKGYTFERYYKQNFPVLTRADRALFEEEIARLTDGIAAQIRRHLPAMRKLFNSSHAVREGWSFEEIAQYAVHAAQRRARIGLEKQRKLAAQFRSAGLDFAFWGTK